MLSRLDINPIARREIKDAIIRTLTKTWPLNARKLYLEIRKNHSSAVTYQGVHKALGQLKEQQIVSEEKRLYCLNADWVNHLNRFALDLETAFLKKRPVSVLDLPLYGSATVESNGVLVEPYFWMLDQTHRVWKAGIPIRAYFFMRRAWPLIVLDDKKYAQFVDSFKDDNQSVCVSASDVADAFFVKIWEQYGFRTKLAVDCAQSCECYVCGDFVFQIFHPKETNDKWDAYYSEFDSNRPTNLMLAHKVAFEIQTPSKFVVTRNPEFAEQLRREANARFMTDLVTV